LTWGQKENHFSVTYDLLRCAEIDGNPLKDVGVMLSWQLK
jgi:hypothetical protein